MAELSVEGWGRTPSCSKGLGIKHREYKEAGKVGQQRVRLEVALFWFRWPGTQEVY